MTSVAHFFRKEAAVKPSSESLTQYDHAATEYARSVATTLEMDLIKVRTIQRSTTREGRQQWEELVRDYETARIFNLSPLPVWENEPKLPKFWHGVEWALWITFGALIVAGVLAHFLGWQGRF